MQALINAHVLTTKRVAIRVEAERFLTRTRVMKGTMLQRRAIPAKMGNRTALAVSGKATGGSGVFMSVDVRCYDEEGMTTSMIDQRARGMPA
jgi:hypothetical protein